LAAASVACSVKQQKQTDREKDGDLAGYGNWLRAANRDNVYLVVSG
jgi:hypothetical protein